jgi:Homeodomain-like domain
MQDTADAAGTFPREVRRVGRRYLQRGLEAALSEDPRPKPPKKFDARSEAAVVALACSPPPPGRSRWSVVVIASPPVARISGPRPLVRSFHAASTG